MYDKMIIELFFSRDEAAISETDKKYGRKLHTISKNITNNDSDSDECVNDTYLSAWNNIPPTRPENYYAYLCRIVRNFSGTCVRRASALKRNSAVLSLDGELAEIISFPTEPSYPDETELGMVIDRFLKESDKDTRFLFVRRYFYADSIEALSEMTGLGKNSVSLRLMRIRKRLKKYIEKDGFTI